MVEPRIIERPDHCVSRELLDEDVIRVLYRLKNNGYQAYVVGGAVRDILRGEHPKDFDVATDATPSQLKKLFRNSRIVGRRFRLVHVIFGKHMVEVATLRQAVEVDESEEDLYIEDDNHWGDVESDAFRRDFTINALFYNIEDFSLIDYVGGVDDIEKKIVRCIGDPKVRFGEDPVRMLRAIKFAARFGFEFEPATAEAIDMMPDEIHKASRFRVTEEIFRILTQKNRERGFELLAEYGFLDELYPHWLEVIGDDGIDQVADVLGRIDAEANEGRFLPLEVIASVLFVPMLGTVDVENDRYHDRAAEIASEVRQLATIMDLPKRLVTTVLTLLRGQLYLLFYAHKPRQLNRFVRAPEFDWVWRLHDLAFGDVEELHGIQERWLHAREQLPQAINGWVDKPDRRDVFSFRGKTGGGRRDEGEVASVVPGRGDGSGGGKRRRGGRRRRRR